MKYLIKTNNRELVEVTDHSRIVYDTSVNKVFCVAPPPIAGDYCLYDKTNNKLVLVKQDKWSIDDYPTDKYEPIGVVVVPSSHNVYGNDCCGVMSIKAMTCDSPSTGGNSNEYMYWGVKGTDISSLPNLSRAPIVGTISSPGDSSGTITEQTQYATLPSDIFTGKQCPHDTNAYYYTSSSLGYAAPSPYLSDGSRNPGYYQTASPSSTSNCLADFDGRGNTDKIITQRGAKDYSSWSPAAYLESDYPAASCCDMFHTSGTQQGDWYLPAMGELGYMMARLKAINKALSIMGAAYGSSYGNPYGATVRTEGYYWSSSELSGGSARVVYTGRGDIEVGARSYRIYVRAFLRVNRNGKIFR